MDERRERIRALKNGIFKNLQICRTDGNETFFLDNFFRGLNEYRNYRLVTDGIVTKEISDQWGAENSTDTQCYERITAKVTGASVIMVSEDHEHNLIIYTLRPINSGEICSLVRLYVQKTTETSPIYGGCSQTIKLEEGEENEIL